MPIKSNKTVATSFSDYKKDAHNWITLATGEYYPDILPQACELYKPVLILFGQFIQSSESSAALFRQICEVSEIWMRIQLARVFRKYVSPNTPVEMLKKKTSCEKIIEYFGKEFRPIQEVQRAYKTRPIPDEALCAVLWEYKDRGKKGYDLTAKLFKVLRERFPSLIIKGPEGAGKDILLHDVFKGYPNFSRPVDFVVYDEDKTTILAIGLARYDSDRGGAQEDDRTGGYFNCAQELFMFTKLNKLRNQIDILERRAGTLARFDVGRLCATRAKPEGENCCSDASDDTGTADPRLVKKLTHMATGLPKSKANGSAEHRIRGASGQVRLEYEGKRSPSEIIRSCPTAKLKLVQPAKHSHGWTNRLYFGENLEVLGTLLKDPDVRGKVSLVYIDPPYSTNSVFESREQKFAYHDLLSGAAFLEFLRERLIVLHELLSERGSIYVHLDDNMAFPMKVVMDEIFGAKNFRNFITRKKCNTKNYTRHTYGNISDYVLFYSKEENYAWNRPAVAWTEDSGKKEYTYVEAATGRRFKKVPVHAPGVRNGETGKPWRGKLPPPSKHWQFPPSALDEMDRRGEIFWSSNGNPRRKIYLDDSSGIPVQDIWLDFKDAHNQNIEITGYPTEKNIEMLEQIISASSNSGDLVLDCFSGSGTTLAAAGNLGRRWIGIDKSDEAISATINRFRFGSHPMGDYVTKKRSSTTETHLELFCNDSDVGQKRPTNGTCEDFDLYRTESAELESRQEEPFALKDKPAKPKQKTP